MTKEPILICSLGHIYNPNSLMCTWWKGFRKEGGKCPEVINYDRMKGTKKCNRVLKVKIDEKKSIPNRQQRYSKL